MSRTQWLLRRSATASGRVVDAPRRGYAWPLDTFVVDPHPDLAGDGRRGAREAAGGTRAAVGGVGAAAPARERGTASRSPAAQHRGDRRRGSPTTSRAARSSSRARPGSRARGDDVRPALVVATRDPQAVADAVPDDPLTHVGRLDARPDSATTATGVPARPAQAQLRRVRGGAAVRRDLDRIEPGWLHHDIVTRGVPILGAVTCTAAVRALRRALGRLHRRGPLGPRRPRRLRGMLRPPPDPGLRLPVTARLGPRRRHQRRSQNPQDAIRGRTDASCAPSRMQDSPGEAAGRPLPTDALRVARRLSWTVSVTDDTFAAVVGSPFSASVPGGRIAGWQQGSGEPVLLIHGGPALDCSYTSELVDELARAHHVATYQQRGIEPSTTGGAVHGRQGGRGSPRRPGRAGLGSGVARRALLRRDHPDARHGRRARPRARRAGRRSARCRRRRGLGRAGQGAGGAHPRRYLAALGRKSTRA